LKYWLETLRVCGFTGALSTIAVKDACCRLGRISRTGKLLEEKTEFCRGFDADSVKLFALCGENEVQRP